LTSVLDVLWVAETLRPSLDVEIPVIEVEVAGFRRQVKTAGGFADRTTCGSVVRRGSGARSNLGKEEPGERRRRRVVVVQSGAVERPEWTRPSGRERARKRIRARRRSSWLRGARGWR